MQHLVVISGSFINGTPMSRIGRIIADENRASPIPFTLLLEYSAFLSTGAHLRRVDVSVSLTVLQEVVP